MTVVTDLVTWPGHVAVAAVRRNPDRLRSVWQAVRIRTRWRRTAQHLRLALTDRTERRTRSGQVRPPRVIVPRLRIRPDDYGVIVTARTVPGVGLAEWQAAARHLADEWRAVRVAVSQSAPGRIQVRAVRRDPLTVPTVWAPNPTAVPVPTDLSRLHIGMDEYGAPVEIRLSGVSGIGVYGLPGYGKTSLINGIISRLAPSPAVQFVAFDGKSSEVDQGDYADVADRLTLLIGDDLGQAHDALSTLVAHRRDRARSIRSLRGTTDAWSAGFTPDWPLLVTVIDEAHTYFSQVKDGGDKRLRERNALAAQNAMAVEDLVKKGRSVGMLTILATQKGTGDAIPTQIRDVCAVSLAFACRTSEASVAALGDDIRQYPDASPVALQDPQYVGVASMIVPGRPGYTRVRMPYVSASVARSIAIHHRSAVISRGSLPAIGAAVDLAPA